MAGSSGPTTTRATTTTHATTTTSAPTTTQAPATFRLTGLSRYSYSIPVGTQTTFPLTVFWDNPPEGSTWVCVGKSELNVPHVQPGGEALAYIGQATGSCSTVGASSGTVTMVVGGNAVGTATYTLFDSEGRASGSFTFTITVT